MRIWYSETYFRGWAVAVIVSLQLSRKCWYPLQNLFAWLHQFSSDVWPKSSELGGSMVESKAKGEYGASSIQVVGVKDEKDRGACCSCRKCWWFWCHIGMVKGGACRCDGFLRDIFVDENVLHFILLAWVTLPPLFPSWIFIFCFVGAQWYFINKSVILSMNLHVVQNFGL